MGNKHKLLSLLLLFCSSIYAESKPTVNALAFWGFLDDPKISGIIESKCNVKFSHDAYWTNSEFLSTYRHRKQEYDVLILSNLIYGSVKNQLPRFNSDLWKSSNSYYPYFKQYYLMHDYSKNTVFFTHAMVGFLYNPAVIKIEQNQSLFDIFKNASDNNVVLVDDSGEVGNMLTEAYKEKYHIKGQTKLTYNNLKNLTQNTKVHITSDFGKVYDSPKFAFAYVWSGDALLFIKKSHKPYKFIMPLNATSICTDLIVQMKNTPQAKCVAQVLSSPLLLKYFENDSYYFSPYFKNNIKDPIYNEIYNQAAKNLPKYHMIQPAHDFDKYYDSHWSSVKVKYLDFLRATQ